MPDVPSSQSTRQNELARRAIKERPLAKLTDAELWTLDSLSGLAIFSEEITAGLESLGTLAHRELNEREFERVNTSG